MTTRSEWNSLGPVANDSHFHSQPDENYHPTYGNETMEMPIDILFVGTITYILVFLVGVCGNLSVIIVLMRNKELRNCTNFFLANLSIADLLVLFACVPSGLHDLYAQEGWYLGKLTCFLVSFIENCMGIASILSILFISCERFFVICKPLSVRTVMTQSRTLKVIAFIWLLSIGINLPFIHLSDLIDDEFIDKSIRKKCLVRSDTRASKIYFIVVTFVIYFIIGIVLMCIYYRISEILKKSTLLFLPTEATPTRTGSITMHGPFQQTTSQFSMNSRSFGLNKHKLASSYSMTSFKDAEATKGDEEQLPKPSLLQRAKKNLKLDRILCKKAQTESDLFREDSKYSLSNRKRGTYFKSSQGNLILLQKSAPKSPNQESSMSRNGSINGGNGFRGSISSPENILNINNNLEKYLKPRRQLIKMLMCVIVAFYVCIFPLKIWNLFLIFISTDENMAQAFFGTIKLRGFWYINITFRLFFYSNSSINPLLYNWLSKKFRQSFKRLFFSSRLCFCFKNKLATAANSNNNTLNNSVYNKYRNCNPHNVSSNFGETTFNQSLRMTETPQQTNSNRSNHIFFRLFSRQSTKVTNEGDAGHFDDGDDDAFISSPTSPFKKSLKLPIIAERNNSQSQSHCATPSQSQVQLDQLKIESCEDQIKHELEEAPLSL